MARDPDNRGPDERGLTVYLLSWTWKSSRRSNGPMTAISTCVLVSTRALHAHNVLYALRVAAPVIPLDFHVNDSIYGMYGLYYKLSYYVHVFAQSARYREVRDKSLMSFPKLCTRRYVSTSRVTPVKVTTLIMPPPVPLDHCHPGQGMPFPVKWSWVALGDSHDRHLHVLQQAIHEKLSVSIHTSALNDRHICIFERFTHQLPWVFQIFKTRIQ